MIVKMKKLTLLCLAAERRQTVDDLAGFGAVQVVNGKMQDSGDRQLLATEITRLERVINTVSGFASKEKAHPYAAGNVALFNLLDGELTEYETALKELDLLDKQIDNLVPWGNFEPKLITDLAAQGIKVELCVFPKGEFKNFSVPDGVTLQVINESKTQVRCVACFPAELKVDNLPSVPLPAAYSMAELQQKRQSLNKTKNELAVKLAANYGHLPRLRQLLSEYQNSYEFLAARDGMAEFGEIAVINGFIPITQTDAFIDACHKHGWGFKLEDPAEDELPPVLLNMPKWLNPIKPLLAFLGILPGYRELDVSMSMLVFMTVFVGMIINDAGYGVLFFIGSLAGIYALRKNPKGRQAAALILIFSIFTIIWGVLSGSWFGVEWGGIKFLTDPLNKNSNIQFICFSLAVVHLSVGHLCRLFKTPTFRNIAAQIGWIMVLAGFYVVAVKVVAYPGALPEYVMYLIGGGVGLLLIFSVNWLDIGSVFNFPFEVINCFTDTLSYIRLFAVGMAGGYMAVCFNGMAMDIMASSAFAIPLGVLLILVAHGLNIALSMISVLVHGVRLNTLEFSSHASLTWSGSEYKPLKKNQ